jgi:hypothetical protein
VKAFEDSHSAERVVRSAAKGKVLEPLGSQGRKALESIKKLTPMVKLVPDLRVSRYSTSRFCLNEYLNDTVIFSKLRTEKRRFHDQM